MARTKTKVKAKAKSKAKTAKNVVKKAAKTTVRRAAVKSAASRKRVAKSSLVKDLGALADKITSMGKSMFEQGSEKAGELARAGIGAVERGGEKISSEIASLKRATLARAKS